MLGSPSVRLNHSALQNENLWNPNKSYSAGGEHLLPSIFAPSFLRVLTPLPLIDEPELAPGAILYPSGSSVASPSSTSSTSPVPAGHSPNSGAIAGGVVGGLAVISITVAAVFLYLRRRSRAPSAVFDIDTSQPLMDDTRWPRDTGADLQLASLSGSPATMRFNRDVRILALRVALVCPHVSSFHFRNPRTRTIQLHPQIPHRNTLAHNHWMCLLKNLYLPRSDPKVPRAPSRPRPRAPLAKDIAAYPSPLSDHSLSSKPLQEYRTDRTFALLLPFPLFSP